MSRAYEAILADNYFGQVVVADPKNEMSSSVVNESDTTANETKSPCVIEELGLPLDDLFSVGRQFLKEKQGSKAIQLKYAEKHHLVGLLRQATIGKWNSSYTENVGLLNIVGNDQKRAWIALGDMSKEQAKEEFIKLLLERCSTFRHYLEAHHVSNKEKNRLKKENEARVLEQEAERIKRYELEQLSRLEEQKKKREEFQRKQIQDALNQQTYPQFKAYAEQQYKDNKQAQEDLIRQLQEQHFQQYIQQVYQQQLLYQQQQQQNRTRLNMEQNPTNVTSSATFPCDNQTLQSTQAPAQPSSVNHASSQPLANGSNSVDQTKVESATPIHDHFASLTLNTSLPTSTDSKISQQKLPSVQINNELSGTQQLIDDNPVGNDSVMNPSSELSLSTDDGTHEDPNIATPNMWTRKDIKEFKDNVRKEKDAILKIGSGETVTVRVPTHEDGRCIFWEFATDHYDIGFGLYFEWSKVQSNTVTIQVSDSSEEDEEGEDSTNEEKKDVEKGSRSSNKSPRPYQDEIIPIYRRDSHEEIYAGSHPYPGNGVYLLKFDNSYSLWRSKTLYYRVYYSR